LAESLSLIAGFESHAPVGWVRGEPITAARFCAAARRLAATLPRRGHVVNLCEDRLNFMLAFAAALIARQVSLLPYSRTPAVAREICGLYADGYCLTDLADPMVGMETVCLPPWSELPGTADAPALPADFEALVAFTSGSTGRPQAHSKTWGSLVSDSRALRPDLGMGDARACTILGTVPAQHVFGLETTVMLPLQNGAAVHSALPLLPADIAAALAELPGERWLVTTPLQLRACVSDRARLPRLGGIVCATMPLSPELAQEAEGLWGAPVQEAYGCTETGAVATRRPARDTNWRLRPGMRVQQVGADVWVEGGHLAEPLRLPDRIEVISDTEFGLLGRPGDLIKIAGKRVSLEALNRELVRVAGVRDGVFFMPDQVTTGQPRLAAMVVAPGIARSEILDALRERIDSAFLPRPLLIVDALPRSASGKLPRANLLAAAATLMADKPHGV